MDAARCCDSKQWSCSATRLFQAPAAQKVQETLGGACGDGALPTRSATPEEPPIPGAPPCKRVQDRHRASGCSAWVLLVALPWSLACKEGAQGTRRQAPVLARRRQHGRGAPCGQPPAVQVGERGGKCGHGGRLQAGHARMAGRGGQRVRQQVRPEQRRLHMPGV